MKIIITGGAGVCGTVLKNLNYEKIFIDKKSEPKDFKKFDYLKVDFKNLNILKKYIAKGDILIHLAATDYYPDFNMKKINATDEDYFKNNILYTKNLFELSLQKKVSKIIFASSSRVLGMYEKIFEKTIYNIKKNILFDHTSEVCPDSYYAVTKLFGENISKYYSLNSDTIFKCIRIGSVRSEKDDNPFAYADYGLAQGLWKKDSLMYNKQKYRLMGLWQSRRDFLQLINKTILSNNKKFEIFFGLSNNDRKWFDLTYTNQSLGYKPLDNSEDFNK